MVNRLKLDFSLETAEERNQFLSTYLVQFDDLTASELETIANYLLWGKASNGKALGDGIEIKTKSGTWDKKEVAESLEALLENPGFNDASLRPLTSGPPTKVTRKIFSRSEARADAPAHLQPIYEDLWAKIDRLDLQLNYYDLKTGKRINPPRDSLLSKFTEEEQDQIRKEAHKLNPYQYLKKRHELVELRREQYTLRDSYKSLILVESHFYQPGADSSIAFEEDIEVFPLGLIDNSEVSQLIFNDKFNPRALNEQQLNLISKFYWKKNENEKTSKRKIDFRNLEDVYQIFLNLYELKNGYEESLARHDVENNTNQLLETLDFYIERANLSEIQKEILHRKTLHEGNQSIAATINQKYGKSYTANYISTIFRQKIIVRINEAAAFHKETIENCFYPEKFKICTYCGRALLLDARNFMRKGRSSDGFNSRCKICEKKVREAKKKKKEEK